MLYPTHTPHLTPTPTPEGMLSRTLDVDAHSVALRGKLRQTDVYLEVGDSVSIRYLYGTWRIGGDSQQPTDADGYVGRTGERAAALVGGAPDKCKILSSAPYGSLIGRIGDSGQMFLIGNSLDFESSADGLLYVGINYVDHNARIGCPYGDSGEIAISVSVIPHP